MKRHSNLHCLLPLRTLRDEVLCLSLMCENCHFQTQRQHHGEMSLSLLSNLKDFPEVIYSFSETSHPQSCGEKLHRLRRHCPVITSFCLSFFFLNHSTVSFFHPITFNLWSAHLRAFTTVSLPNPMLISYHIFSYALCAINDGSDETLPYVWFSDANLVHRMSSLSWCVWPLSAPLPNPIATSPAKSQLPQCFSTFLILGTSLLTF